MTLLGSRDQDPSPGHDLRNCVQFKVPLTLPSDPHTMLAGPLGRPAQKGLSCASLAPLVLFLCQMESQGKREQTDFSRDLQPTFTLQCVIPLQKRQAGTGQPGQVPGP